MSQIAKEEEEVAAQVAQETQAREKQAMFVDQKAADQTQTAITTTTRHTIPNSSAGVIVISDSSDSDSHGVCVNFHPPLFFY